MKIVLKLYEFGNKLVWDELIKFSFFYDTELPEITKLETQYF